MAAAAPLAPVIYEVTWETTDTVGNSNQENARDRGLVLAYNMEFNSAAPPLRRILSPLPWPRVDVPG